MAVVNEFEQSDLEKEVNDSNNNCYQNAICYKGKESAFIKNCSCVFLFSFLKSSLMKPIEIHYYLFDRD